LATPAEAAIRDAIAREGRITFRTFMEMALYSAPGAYYSGEGQRIGASGDYYTSPELHPSFGALVARQLEQVWVCMGRPSSFTIVEVGAGKGALARDILRYTARCSPAFDQAISYLAVERSANPPRRALGGGRDETTARLAWIGDPTTSIEGDSIEGCFLSNELLDAFPVHRVTVVDGTLREIYLEIRQGRIVETVDEPSDPRLSEYFSRLGFLPPEGFVGEVNLDAMDWIQWVATSLRRGAVLTFDYGYAANELYSPLRSSGTLMCFYRHTISTDPYFRIGQQDITAHVDFTSLAAEGSRWGLQPFDLVTQRSFLVSMGMGDYLQRLEQMGLPQRSYQANWVAMEELMNPEGLGRVKLLLQQKGLEGFDPAGLRHSGVRSTDLGRDLSREEVPLLTPDHLPLTELSPTEPMVDLEGMWQELMGGEEGESSGDEVM